MFHVIKVKLIVCLVFFNKLRTRDDTNEILIQRHSQLRLTLIDVVSVMHVFSPRAIMVSEVFVCESETDCSDLGCLHPFNKVIDLGARTKK